MPFGGGFCRGWKVGMFPEALNKALKLMITIIRKGVASQSKYRLFIFPLSVSSNHQKRRKTQKDIVLFFSQNYTLEFRIGTCTGVNQETRCHRLRFSRLSSLFGPLLTSSWRWLQLSSTIFSHLLKTRSSCDQVSLLPKSASACQGWIFFRMICLKFLTMDHGMYIYIYLTLNMNIHVHRTVLQYVLICMYTHRRYTA